MDGAKSKLYSGKTRALGTESIWVSGWEEEEGGGKGKNEHEKTRAAAAPRKPKKGAVSSPLNTDDILFASGFLLLLLSLPLCGGLLCSVSGVPRRWGEEGGTEGGKGRWVGQASRCDLSRAEFGFFLLRCDSFLLLPDLI